MAGVGRPSTCFYLAQRSYPEPLNIESSLLNYAKHSTNFSSNDKDFTVPKTSFWNQETSTTA